MTLGHEGAKETTMRVYDYSEDKGDFILFTTEILTKKNANIVGIRDMGHLSIYAKGNPQLKDFPKLFHVMRQNVSKEGNVHVYTFSSQWLVIAGECIDNCSFLEFYIPKNIDMRGNESNETCYDYDDQRSGYLIFQKKSVFFVHDPDEFSQKKIFLPTHRLFDVAKYLYKNNKE